MTFYALNDLNMPFDLHIVINLYVKSMHICGIHSGTRGRSKILFHVENG